MEIAHTRPQRLLNPATGYIEGYDYSLNPYSGCAFACSYCYVRKMPVQLFKQKAWGSWLKIKDGAAERLRRELANARRKERNTRIFMSTSTDPYQPAEYTEKVTRSMLQVMLEMPPDFLLLQTRSPLVTRDIDLLQQLGDRVRVSVTVETDLEDMRRHFTPQAPPLQARRKAMKELRDAGVAVQAAISPVLPCSEAFAEQLQGCADRVVIDDYFQGDGAQGRRTEQLGIRRLYEEIGLLEWYHPLAYRQVHQQMLTTFSEEQVFVGQEGFLP